MQKTLSGILQGQTHWRAKLTDREVELMRQLHEDGMRVTEIAAKFDISKSHVSRITRYLSRCAG